MMIDTPEFFRDPHATYARLRAEGPARRVATPAGGGFWLVTRYDEAQLALRDKRFSKRFETAKPAGLDGVVLAMVNDDPPDHTRLRGMLSRSFDRQVVDGLEASTQRTADALLSRLAGRPVVDLIRSFAVPLPYLVICDLLGIPAEWRPKLRPLLFGSTASWSVAQASGQRRDWLSEFFGSLVAECSSATSSSRFPPGGLLARLVAEHTEADRLSHAELVEMAVLLFIAGHETTANLIGNGVLALLRHPEQLAMLVEEPTRIPRAVEELARFDGPLGRATFRVATETVEIGDSRIAPGEVVSVGLLSANRDPEKFVAPDRLDVTRWPNPHLAFGRGIHYCLGAALARSQARIAIGALLARYPELGLACRPADLRWIPSGFSRGLASLPVLTRNP